MTGTYLLAGVSIRIDSVYDEVQRMCADYRTDLAPQVTITTTPDEIEAERQSSEEARVAEGIPAYDFPLPYLETLAVYRKIATALMPMGVMLMHGSVIAVDDQAYMFTAVSGTGKSTHVRLWRKLFGKRAVMVNDDKPLIRIKGDNPDQTPLDAPLVYGTPWDGKHHLSNNIAVPLRAIVILNRGIENEIHPISIQDAFPILLQQSFRNDDPLSTIQAMQLLSLLAQHVRFFDLHCNMDPEAARIAYEGMR